MLRQGRDSTRMREIGSIHRALSMFQVDSPTASIGAINTIHISIPSTDSTCANLGLPPPLTGWTYRCVNADNLRRIDGNGWIPVNFTTMSQGSPLSHLPIDPTNTAVSSNFYVYVTDGRTWVLASLIESERHTPSAVRDGGTDFARFEAGNNLALWSAVLAPIELVGYWSFDGTGSITHNQTTGLRDTSERNNHGTASNANATGMAFVPGRVGNAVTFDGVDDRVGIGRTWNSLLGVGTSDFTIDLWVRYPTQGAFTGILGTYSDSGHAGVWLGVNGERITLRMKADGTPAGFLEMSTPLTYNDNQWHHIVFVANRKSLGHIYVNGILRVSGDISVHSSTLGGGLINIGFIWRHFNGLIDEVRIYNRALTEAEIRTIFNATR